MAYDEVKKTGQAYRVLVSQDPSTGKNTYDRLSFWTAADDVEFRNHTTLESVSDTFFYAEGTLLTGETQITIYGSNITEDGLLDIYVPDEFCKVTPDSIDREGLTHAVNLTFPAQSKDMPIRVVCKQFGDVNAQTQ